VLDHRASRDQRERFAGEAGRAVAGGDRTHDTRGAGRGRRVAGLAGVHVRI
jgi:hypothetical protein